MKGDETNKDINTKCYDCCHFKIQNMELYKLNLPNGIVNHIIDYDLLWVKTMNVRIVGYGTKSTNNWESVGH